MALLALPALAQPISRVVSQGGGSGFTSGSDITTSDAGVARNLQVNGDAGVRRNFSVGGDAGFANNVGVVGELSPTGTMLRPYQTATAFAGGGQASATQLASTWGTTYVTTATSSDSVKLPASPSTGFVLRVCTITSATSLALFPASGGTINGGAANASILIGQNSCRECHAASSTAWYCY